MNFYIDIEANEIEEIIAIGIISENGDEFYSLVQPKEKNKITPHITDLTGITSQKANSADSAEIVFARLEYWLQGREFFSRGRHFICYGDDLKYLRATARRIEAEKAFQVIGCIMANLDDCRKEVGKFFGTQVSLIDAYRYLIDPNKTQKHNALEDARMVKEVLAAIDGKEPIHKEYSLVVQERFTPPTGIFYAKPTRGPEIKFDNFAEILAFMQENNGLSREAQPAHIANKILAVCNKPSKKYMNYRWRRVQR